MKPYDIVLISCSSSKLNHAAPAADLYSSQLFRAAKKWAEQNGTQWAILSAKHGIVDPTDVIEPYNETLKGKGKDARRQWAGQNQRWCMEYLQQNDFISRTQTFPDGRKTSDLRVCILAGQDYIRPLKEFPQYSFINRSEAALPLEGMPIGKRLQWLKENTTDTSAATEEAAPTKPQQKRKANTTARQQTNYNAAARPADLFAPVRIERFTVGTETCLRVAGLLPIESKNGNSHFRGLEANIQPADYPQPTHNNQPLIVACGIGTDSIGMLIAMRNRGIRPDVVQWADTGSEREHTYRYINTLINWLKRNDFPPLLIVRKRCPIAGHRGLYEQLWNTEQLPSPAFHRNHSCSAKWKLEPQRDYHSFLPWLNQSRTAVGFSAEESERIGIREAVGFSAEETDRRSYQIADADGYQTWFPLQEWNLTRKNCVELIDSEGIPQPGKSACFMCPMSQLCELRRMSSRELSAATELEARAEAGGKLRKIRGLRKGINQTWDEWLEETATEPALEFVGLHPTI